MATYNKEEFIVSAKVISNTEDPDTEPASFSKKRTDEKNQMAV